MTTAQIESAAGASPPPSRPRRVALFATCFNDTMWPEAPKATVRLLERLGVQVDFPMEQTCCGQMFTNTGYANDAKGLVRGFVDTFDAFDYVVAPSGSCTGSVREQHEMIAERVGDQGLAREVDALAPRVLELSEFLVDVLGVTDVGAYFPHRITYHPTCHSLRMLGVGDRPLRLLLGDTPGWRTRAAELALAGVRRGLDYEVDGDHAADTLKLLPERTRADVLAEENKLRRVTGKEVSFEVKRLLEKGRVVGGPAAGLESAGMR